MKLLSSILILGIILGLAVSLALAFTTPSEARGKSTSQTIEVTVGLGDTVWDLAVEYGPRGADPRSVVYDIAEINDLNGYVIRPGDKIAIPNGH